MNNGRTKLGRRKWTLLFAILAVVGLGFFGYEFWQWILPALPLPNATGSFSLSSVPSGAVVHWKDRELGRTPLKQYVLPPGDQVVELTIPGYQPCPIEFTIKAGSIVDLGVRSLAKQLGKLKLVTDPAGASYLVVGPDKKTIAGMTPDTLENLPWGKYDVKLTEPGWPDYKQVADIDSGEPVEVSRQFKGGSVELTSDPAGATIFVGGSKLGTAPLSANLPIGPVEVTSRFGALSPVVQTLVPDREKVSSFQFKHSYGTLLVSSDRTDAVLIVDGMDFGHPPAQLFLAPGNHKLLLSAPSAPDKTRRVDLLEGQHVSVEINFGTANGDVAAVVSSSVTATPTPVPTASHTAPPAPTAANTPRPAQLVARTTPTPQPVSSPTPQPTQASQSPLSPAPTPEEPTSSPEDQPVIPPANTQATPMSDLTPPPGPPKSVRSTNHPTTVAKKANTAATPSASASAALRPEQARNKAEARQLLAAELKAEDDELKIEKNYIDYQIKHSSGADREQWKYRLAEWRSKKAHARQERAAREARLKEEWR